VVYILASECESVRRRILAYLGHDLDCREGEKINHHLQSCPSCYALYFRWRAKSERLRRELRDWVCENRLPDGWSEEFREELLKAAHYQEKGLPLNPKRMISRNKAALGGERIKISLLLVAAFIIIILVSPFLSWLTLHLPVYGPLVKELLSF